MTYYQPLKTNFRDSNRTALTVPLKEGQGHLMGCGLVLIRHGDNDAALSRRDLEAMQAADGALDVALDDGTAFHMGEGSYVITQGGFEVGMAANDVAAMLAAVACVTDGL